MKILLYILIGVFLVALVAKVYLIDKYKEREIKRRVDIIVRNKKFEAEISNARRIEYFDDRLKAISAELNAKTLELENAMSIIRKYQTNELSKEDKR